MLIELGSHYASSMVVPIPCPAFSRNEVSVEPVSQSVSEPHPRMVPTSKSTNWFRFHHPDLIEERPTVEVLALPTVTVISASCLLHYIRSNLLVVLKALTLIKLGFLRVKQ